MNNQIFTLFTTMNTIRNMILSFGSRFPHFRIIRTLWPIPESTLIPIPRHRNSPDHSDSAVFLIFCCLIHVYHFFTLNLNLEKSKITKKLNSEENQFGKSIITWQNQITKRIKNEWTRTVIFLTWYRHFQM